MKLNDKPLHLKHGGYDNFNAKISSDVTVICKYRYIYCLKI